MLVVRVETDWYVHGTEFRYQPQPGDRISGQRSMLIGQVFFVPRTEITMPDSTEDELAAMNRADEEFSCEKAADHITTPTAFVRVPIY
jgi:hypothetical protein